MKRIIAVIGSLLLALVLVAPAALAADETLPHTGRVLIATEGDLTVPVGEHADLVVVAGGTATILGEVNTVVVSDGSADLQGATVETLIAVRSPVTVGAGVLTSSTANRTLTTSTAWGSAASG